MPLGPSICLACAPPRNNNVAEILFGTGEILFVSIIYIVVLFGAVYIISREMMVQEETKSRQEYFQNGQGLTETAVLDDHHKNENVVLPDVTSATTPDLVHEHQSSITERPNQNSSSALPYLCIIRDSNLVVEAGAHQDEENVGDTLRHLLNRKNTVGWDSYPESSSVVPWKSKTPNHHHPFRGLRFHLYQKKENETVVTCFIFACVYNSSILSKGTVQSFMERVVVMVRALVESEDPNWEPGQELECQNIFSPIFQEWMMKKDMQIMDESLELSRQIIENNRRLLTRDYFSVFLRREAHNSTTTGAIKEQSLDWISDDHVVPNLLDTSYDHSESTVETMTSTAPIDLAVNDTDEIHVSASQIDDDDQKEEELTADTKGSEEVVVLDEDSTDTESPPTSDELIAAEIGSLAATASNSSLDEKVNHAILCVDQLVGENAMFNESASSEFWFDAIDFDASDDTMEEGDELMDLVHQVMSGSLKAEEALKQMQLLDCCELLQED